MPVGHDDTIAALSTPEGISATALIRVSGPNALRVADRVWKGISPTVAEPRRCYYGKVVGAEGAVISDGLMTPLLAPASFTGEDTVELSVLGGSGVPSETLGAICRAGGRLAERGEFSYRAYRNGKITLFKAETANRLIRASSSYSRKAVRGRGKLLAELKGLSREIASTLPALIVTSEFPAEGDYPLPDLSRFVERLDLLHKATCDFSDVQSGVSVVIAGRPNVGKSTLLNALLGRDRALVDSRPGTTRDYISEQLSTEGLLLSVTDTAGIASPKDPVEAGGVAKSLELAREADVLVWLHEGDEPPQGINPHIKVRAKADTLRNLGDDAVSGKTGYGVKRLLNRIVRAAPEAGIPVNMSEQARMETAVGSLSRALSMYDGGEVALAHEELGRCLESLCRLTGEKRETDEETIRRTFSEFCTGK